MLRSDVIVFLVLCSLRCCWVASAQDCPPAGNSSDQTAGPAGYHYEKTILIWHGILMLIGLGVLSLLVCLVYIVIRKYIYYDSHLLDTFFDAGGDTNFALVAASVVAKWIWTSSFAWSTNDVRQFGLVGHFWFAAASAVHLFLFSIVANEIRVKAPGAKTYLQVIRARFGAPSHIIVMIFALVANILVSGMVLTEGSKMLATLTQGLSFEVIVIITSIVVIIFNVVGGVGGSIYNSYIGCCALFSILLVYLVTVLYNPMKLTHVESLGSPRSIYETVRCAQPLDTTNDQASTLTFVSHSGLLEGIVIILSGFSSVFVDQSYWQSSIAGKPSHSVWGFLVGGIVYFAMPFCMAYSFGMPYLIYTTIYSDDPVTDDQALNGTLPIYMSQWLLGRTGDYLMFVIVMVAMVTTLSGEMLAASSIIVYDIYQAYISPFVATPVSDNEPMKKAIRNEEYLEYDRRSVLLKHVVVVSTGVLMIPIALIIWAIGIDLPWLFEFLAILVGSCVLPISLAITWHRITGIGLIAGALGGFAASVIVWLAYASQFPGGLHEFHVNTGQPEVMLAGTAVALGAGGLLCFVVSLASGGCDSDLEETDEWEKTRDIDNPVLPWSIKYASELGPQTMTRGRPHFYVVRRTFKLAEICAYILGVLFSVVLILIWPAGMLTVDVFDANTFIRWSIMVLVWAVVATAFICLAPLVAELVQVCRQAYYNRQWTKSEQASPPAQSVMTAETLNRSATTMAKRSFAEDGSVRNESESGIRNGSVLTGRSGSHRSMNDRDSSKGNQRWKTFIPLD